MNTREREHKVVIQITDTHLEPVEGPDADASVPSVGVGAYTDTFETLRWIVGTLSRVRPRSSFIVFSGDLADRGDQAAYRRARELVEPVAQDLGAQVMWIPGNHDRVSEFRQALLDQEPSDEPLDQVMWDGDTRLIGLDSSVLGQAYGELEERQLRWLANELRTPARLGTVVAIHHPPVESPMRPFLSYIGLEHPERLAEVIAGTDVRLVVAGHVHYAGLATLGAIPVWIAPAAAHQTDLAADASALRAVTGSAYTRVDLVDGRAFASQVRVTRDETEISVVHPHQLQQLAHRAKHEPPPPSSRSPDATGHRWSAPTAVTSECWTPALRSSTVR